MTAKYDWHGNEWDYLTGLNPAKLSASNYGLVICLEIVARAETGNFGKSPQKRSGETSAGTRPVRPLNFAAMRIPVNQTNVRCPCGKTSSARLIEYGEVGETSY